MNNFGVLLKMLHITLLTGCLPIIFCGTSIASGLRAGVCKVDITRSSPTSPVNDPLYARVLVLGNRETTAVFISLDILGLSFNTVDDIKSRIEKELKIERNNVLINVSHNHWVNDQLSENYIDLILNATREASLKMLPVRAGAGAGVEKRITMNRRIVLSDGNEWTIRRATPEPEDTTIKGIADAFDPEIGILRIDKPDGKTLAVLYTFAGHNYSGVPNRGATAGFPGFASSLIEETLGNGAIALFFQGAAGDITPILYKDVNTPKQDEAFGTKLGLSTLSAYRRIVLNKDARLTIIREELELPARNDVQMHIDTLEARKIRILDYFKGQGCGAHGAGTKLNFRTFLPLYLKYTISPGYPSDYPYRYMQEEKIGSGDLEMMDTDNKRDIEKYMNNIYKMEELITIEANLGYLKGLNTKNPVKAETVGMRIGNFVLVTFSGELFSQIGLNIKNNSPFEYTFVSGYTNGSVGYSPTSEAYSGDAYEVSGSGLAPEWQSIFEEKANDILNKLNK